jgi:hypothetical protein
LQPRVVEQERRSLHHLKVRLRVRLTAPRNDS